MTVAEMHGYFDLLIDKVGDPYFLPTEKDTFLTNAALQFTRDYLLPRTQGVSNFEFDQLSYSNVDTLVFETAQIAIPGTGKIPNTTIQTALNTASGSTEPLMFIVNASWIKGTDVLPIKYVRQNEWYETENNVFKRGTTSQPRYKQDGSNVTISPISTGSYAKFTIIKQPKVITLTPPVNCDLPEETHKRVVEMAVELASISLRDTDLYQTNAKNTD